MRLLIRLFAIVFAAGCGKNQLLIDHSLPPSPAHKPTAECLSGVGDLRLVVGTVAGYLDTNYMFFPGGTCALTLLTDSPADALAAVKRVKLAQGTYSYFNEHGTSLNVWVDVPATKLPVVNDKNGKPIDPSPAQEDCDWAASILADAKLQGTPTTVVNTDKFAIKDSCYVELKFHDDVNFEKFFSWTNPNTMNGELLHFYRTKASGVISMIRVHVIGQ